MIIVDSGLADLVFNSCVGVREVQNRPDLSGYISEECECQTSVIVVERAENVKRIVLA